MGNLPELILGNEGIKEAEAVTQMFVPEDAAQPENALALSSLSQDERKVVLDFAGKIDISDQSMIMQYGGAAQNKVAKFSDNVLQSVRTKDLGPAGKALAELVGEIKSFDASGEEKKTGLAGLFTRGNAVKKNMEKMIAGYDKVSNNIDNITSVLENHKRSLMKDIALMDELYKSNHEYFKEISMYIIAGEERLREFREKDISKQTEIAKASGGDMEAHKLNDMINMADRFEKKLHDLKLTRMISIQMAPQIRMIQNNDAVLAEKIQSSINNSIPLWKNQMVIALGLANSQSALEAQKKVTDMTNELLLKNSEMLRQSSTGIAKAAEESIISIDTVRKTNENLIATINEVLDIQKKGAEGRAAAENELQKLEGDLKTALLEAANRKR